MLRGESLKAFPTTLGAVSVCCSSETKSPTTRTHTVAAQCSQVLLIRLSEASLLTCLHCFTVQWWLVSHHCVWWLALHCLDVAVMETHPITGPESRSFTNVCRSNQKASVLTFSNYDRSAGLRCASASYRRFITLYLNTCSLRGRRLLSAEMIQRAISKHRAEWGLCVAFEKSRTINNSSCSQG